MLMTATATTATAASPRRGLSVWGSLPPSAMRHYYSYTSSLQRAGIPGSGPVLLCDWVDGCCHKPRRVLVDECAGKYFAKTANLTAWQRRRDRQIWTITRYCNSNLRTLHTWTIVSAHSWRLRSKVSTAITNGVDYS